MRWWLLIVLACLTAVWACGSGGGTREIGSGVVELEARNVAFGAERLLVPADREFQLNLLNEDGGIPHNFAIYRARGSAEALFRGEIFEGRSSRIYDIGPLEKGTYVFRCDTHPSAMMGEVVAE